MFDVLDSEEWSSFIYHFNTPLEAVIICKRGVDSDSFFLSRIVTWWSESTRSCPTCYHKTPNEASFCEQWICGTCAMKPIPQNREVPSNWTSDPMDPPPSSSAPMANWQTPMLWPKENVDSSSSLCSPLPEPSSMHCSLNLPSEALSIVSPFSPHSGRATLVHKILKSLSRYVSYLLFTPIW